MSASSSFEPLPTRGITVWIVIGCLFALASGYGTWALWNKREAEMQRFVACQSGTRQDCEMSLFWALAGLSMPDTGTDLSASVTDGTHQQEKRAVRSSETAPTIFSVKPEGVAIDGQGYRIAQGDRVTFTVNAEDAASLELFFRPAVTNATSTSLIVMQPTQAGGDYTASFTWKDKQAGELEIRAKGKGAADQASLFIPISVEIKP